MNQLDKLDKNYLLVIQNDSVHLKKLKWCILI